MNIVIITGLSGAGKSHAANFLEDAGYFCIDNMPPSLIPRFGEMLAQLKKDSQIALVTDVRTGDQFGSMTAALDELTAMGFTYKIIFVEADDDILIRRFSESRRKHPLAGECNSMAEAIRLERAQMAPLYNAADYHIDTSKTSLMQLRDMLFGILLPQGSESMQVRVLSFGYKHGLPLEADLVLDVRFLPNPFYIETLKPLTGLDPAVAQYALQNEAAAGLLRRCTDLFDFLLPHYREEGKSQLTVAIGCTGGKHRSVAVAQVLYQHIKSHGYLCEMIHRDIEKTL